MSRVSYKKLWIRLAEKEMKRVELSRAVGFSEATLSKLGKNEPVSLTVLIRICDYLGCDIGDIIELVGRGE